MTATPANYETWITADPIHKTWSKMSYQGPTPSGTGCGTPLPTSLSSFPELAAGLREYLACGTLSYEGKQQVDGVNALKLVSVQHQRQGKTLTTIIWVDPGTYLPVRMTAQWTQPPRSPCQAASTSGGSRPPVPTWPCSRCGSRPGSPRSTSAALRLVASRFSCVTACGPRRRGRPRRARPSWRPHP